MGKYRILHKDFLGEIKILITEKIMKYSFSYFTDEKASVRDIHDSDIWINNSVKN